MPASGATEAGGRIMERMATVMTCGCEVETYRDFLGRVVGKVLTRGEQCPRPEHIVGQVVIMPGREHARPD
jgi:hypothetical protein